MDKQAFDEWLEKLRSLGMKPGLSRVKELLTRMDNPQNKLDIIHITGTNGKGTTATLIRNILIEGGYKVGQFSSPSIISFNHMFDIADLYQMIGSTCWLLKSSPTVIKCLKKVWSILLSMKLFQP